jgi:hypothetical protein
MPNSVDQSPETGAVPLANRAPNRVSRGETGTGTFALALSRVIEIGEQAVAAVAASLAGNGTVLLLVLIVAAAPYTKTDTASSRTDPDVRSAAIADWRDAH